MVTAILICLLPLLRAVASALATEESIVCSWALSRAGEVRGALYIDGGFQTRAPWNGTIFLYNDFGAPRTIANGTMFRFNYTSTFNMLDGPERFEELLEPIPLTASGPYDAPPYIDGALLTSDLEFYTYGGLPEMSTGLEEIVSYQLYGISNQPGFNPGPQTHYRLDGINAYVAFGSSASVPSERLAFYFSGLRRSDWGPLSLNAQDNGTGSAQELANTFIKADLSNPGKVQWTNSTLPDHVLPRARSQLVWIPAGKQGLLLAIGGVPFPEDVHSDYVLDDTQEEENKRQGSEFMSSIAVYDIAGDKWYNQSTTGTGPTQLQGFCAVTGSQSGSSTHEIFVYGGSNALSFGAKDWAWSNDALYILSVPSFTWIKASEGTRDHGRSGHFCSTPLPNRMLVFGGQRPDENLCLTNGKLMDALDLNTLQWLGRYDPRDLEEYQTPQLVRDALVDPAEPIEEVAALFNIKYPKSYDDYPLDLPSAPKANLAPIIGGAAGGGAVLLLLIAFLIWYCRPKRREQRQTRRRQRRTSSAAKSESTKRQSVMSWLGATPAPHALPKSVVSEAATEVGETPLSPAVPELHGGYFAPVQRTRPEMAEVAAGNPVNRLSGQTAASSPFPVAPISSPSSPQSSAVEVEGRPVERYEVHGQSRRSPFDTPSAPSSNRGSYSLRDHHLYPYSVDGNRSQHDGSQSYQDMSVRGGTNSDSTAPDGFPPHSPSGVTDPSSRGARKSFSQGLPSPLADSQHGDPELPDTTGMAPIFEDDNNNPWTQPEGPPPYQHSPPLSNRDFRLSASSDGPISPLFTHRNQEQEQDDLRPGHSRQISDGPSLPSPAAEYPPPPRSSSEPHLIQYPEDVEPGSQRARLAASTATIAEQLREALRSPESTIMSTSVYSPTVQSYSAAGAGGGFGDDDNDGGRAPPIRTASPPSPSSPRRKPVGGRAAGQSAYSQNWENWGAGAGAGGGGQREGYRGYR